MATKPSLIENTSAIDAAPAMGPVRGVSEAVAGGQSLRSRARHGVLQVRNRMGAALLRAGLEHDEFTVLSNDCWGQAIYESYGLPCQTPLAGAGLYADCFMRFLGNIEGYLRSPLEFVPETRHLALGRIRNQRGARTGRWPIALLGGDVEIHFLHFLAEEESRRSWHDGLDRLNLNRIAVKLSADKDGVTQEQVKQFAAMPFERKLVISRRSMPDIDCALQTPNWVNNGAVMFRRSVKHFDCTHWLNTGEILRNTPRVWACKAIFARGV